MTETMVEAVECFEGLTLPRERLNRRGPGPRPRPPTPGDAFAGARTYTRGRPLPDDPRPFRYARIPTLRCTAAKRSIV
jgi:hypothetical protein